MRMKKILANGKKMAYISAPKNCNIPLKIKHILLQKGKKNKTSHLKHRHFQSLYKANRLLKLNIAYYFETVFTKKRRKNL